MKVSVIVVRNIRNFFVLLETYVLRKGINPSVIPNF